MQKVLKRQEVPKEHTWDLDSMFPSDQAWEDGYQKATEMIPTLASHQGKLGESAQTLVAALKDRDAIYKVMGKVYVYSSMRKDQDAANPTYQGLHQRAQSLYSRVGTAGAYMTPEILSIPADRLRQFLSENAELKAYDHELQDLIRQKEHVRSQEVEEVLAQGRELGAAPYTIFSTFTGAELKFPKVKDEAGNEVDLTEGRFPRFRESPNQEVRKGAFEALLGTYEKYRNTLASSLVANVKRDVFNARVRRYPSARAGALAGNNIPEAVYDNLVTTVNKNLPTLHRYLKLRKRILGLDELHVWDLYNPIVADVDRKIPYDEAVASVLTSVQPLGPEYLKVARQGLGEERWVDVYENEGKRSGAYSSGTYGTRPFILLNYAENLDSMFTLTHELGHSMHSYFTRATQPFHYGDYSIFLAEVASTLNEALLTAHLLKETDEKRVRMYLLNHSLESFRTTLYRQTMFAEFEHLIHQKSEANEALTADSLTAMYYELNKRYYGTEGMVVDELIGLEWLRIPHFYYNYYVFQYATGLSAATALAQQVLEEGQPAVDRYLAFLKAGSSAYSIDILKQAGVDMTTPEPIQKALDVFAAQLTEMESLLG